MSAEQRQKQGTHFANAHRKNIKMSCIDKYASKMYIASFLYNFYDYFYKIRSSFGKENMEKIYTDCL